MNLIPYNPEFHPVIATWWESHEWPVIPIEALPATGRIATNDRGEMVCAVWLYRTDSTIAWLDFYISDPRASKTEVSEGLDLIIEELSLIAKDNGFHSIFTSLGHRGLLRRLGKHNFQVADNNMTNLVRALCQ